MFKTVFLLAAVLLISSTSAVQKRTGMVGGHCSGAVRKKCAGKVDCLTADDKTAGWDKDGCFYVSQSALGVDQTVCCDDGSQMGTCQHANTCSEMGFKAMV
jgi:hypothetical protein